MVQVLWKSLATTQLPYDPAVPLYASKQNKCSQKPGHEFFFTTALILIAKE